MDELKANAKQFLKDLISIPSISGEEEGSADLIKSYLSQRNIPFHQRKNNIIVKNLRYDDRLPTILLNSHHDTVKPSASYTRNPFFPDEENGKIFGLGSNDAGGALVALWACFVYFYEKKMNYNLIFAATAEEEISGENGIRCILQNLGNIELAIVGEPTKMDIAIAEKGLVVLNCTAKGTSSHVAHENDDNAIYNAIHDIEFLRDYHFEKESPLLGKVKITVSMINAGTQHNVVPAECSFTVDIRTNEFYDNECVVNILKPLLKSEIKPRSLILNSSSIAENHAIAEAAKKSGCLLYGSPTISDQALMPFPSVKIGPGDSLRSHTADEFIYEKELYHGIEKYVEILSRFLKI